MSRLEVIAINKTITNDEGLLYMRLLIHYFSIFTVIQGFRKVTEYIQ